MSILFKLFASTLAVVSVVNAGELLNFENERDIIRGSYIVVMKDGTSSSDLKSHMNWAANVHHGNLAKQGPSRSTGFQFSFDIGGWRGYSGKFDNDTLDAIVNNAHVKYVEPDRMASATVLKIQKNAPSWGLGRISHTFRGFKNYLYHSSAGEGVLAYVVDTGIDIRDPEFEGLAEWGINVVDEVDTDEHGHGTHTFGVAKKVKLVAVKALGKDSRGPDSGIIAAMDWAVKHAKEKVILVKAIMNLSLTGDPATALNESAERAPIIPTDSASETQYFTFLGDNRSCQRLRSWDRSDPCSIDGFIEVPDGRRSAFPHDRRRDRLGLQGHFKFSKDGGMVLLQIRLILGLPNDTATMLLARPRSPGKTGFLCPPASHAGIAGSDIAREGLALSRAPFVFLFLSYLYRLRDFVHPSLLPLPTGSDLAILPIEKVSFAVLEKSKACPGHSRLLLTDNDPMYP
ncbi:subtilase-type proteinase psp3 [Coccidioides immitis RMSCC 3703]|uniref:Subtilase-type proteinase psp3 n=1 Tax=Coccidioides immitis RMSCC 3703 TaxID=454286 RepID=A0A0J8QWT6_COCIT|nr:subtilase-type proteinase psp3 [Coccidioides immitis RMSCC 3703]